MTTAFTGWPPEAFEFFVRLEADNTKRFWQSNREIYETAVRAPMEAFGAPVTEDYGPLHTFRPIGTCASAPTSRPTRPLVEP